MAPTLYTAALSPPVRSVIMTEKALGLKFNYVEVDLAAGDHMKPEFLKINPQHTIPTFVDSDGTVVWDSHAIMTYLVEKYGKNDALYPKDLKVRAVVDQRLHFDSGCVFGWLRAIVYPRKFHGIQTIPDYVLEQVESTYSILDNCLDGKKYMAGNAVTIADFSLITSVTGLDYLVKIDKKYKNLHAWIQLMTSHSLYDHSGFQAFVAYIDNMTK